MWGRIGSWSLILMIGIIIGVAGEGYLAPHVAGATAGDWLQFLGTGFALVVTVLAAVVIEGFKAGAEDRREHKMIADAFDAIDQAATAFRRIADIERPWIHKRFALVGGLDSIIAALRKFAFVHQRVEVEDIDLMEELYQMRASVDWASKLLAPARSKLAECGDNEPVITNITSTALDVCRGLTDRTGLARKTLKAAR